MEWDSLPDPKAVIDEMSLFWKELKLSGYEVTKRRDIDPHSWFAEVVVKGDGCLAALYIDTQVQSVYVVNWWDSQTIGELHSTDEVEDAILLILSGGER